MRRADPFIGIPETAFTHTDRWHTGSALDVIAAGLRQLYADPLRQPIPPQFIALIKQFEKRRGEHDA
jgi:hypothetical protein